MSDEELDAIIRTYGNQQNDIKYLEFINDANPNGNGSDNGASQKTPYLGTSQNFSGESDVESLLFKIKAQIKKDRIRLGEFFQDHDMLRKGNVAAQKFRGVLYAQKI